MATYTDQEYRDYVNQYPDLQKAQPADMSIEQWGKQHYEKHGKAEGRLTPTRAKTSEWWERKTSEGEGKGVELAGLTKYSDNDYLKYVLGNPDLRELSEALGLTQSEAVVMGKQHWGVFGTDAGGKGEGTGGFAGTRLNRPGVEGRPEAYTEALSGQHLGGAAARDYVQRIAQNAPGSEMWTARGTISPQWVLNQFSGEGWNLDADRPYYRGLLDDQIEVNKSLGQLVPTTAEGNVGDLRFLQDRYIDEYRLKGADFPTGWVDEQGNWTDKAPAQLGAFWDVLKTAYRDPVTGELRRRVNYDPSTALGLSIYDGSNNLGGTNEYLLTDYTRPQLQDLSHLMPPEGLLNTPAQRAMVANQGAVWQPWAQTPEYTWSPTGAATYTPRVLPSLLDSNTEDISTVNGSTKPLFGDPTEWSFYSANFGGPGKGYKFTDFLNWTAWDHAGRPTGSQNNPFTGTWAPVLPTPTS
jgi:hypothetical protein